MVQITAKACALIGLILNVLTNMAGATSYSYSMEYSGETFFDRWSFFDQADNLTHGDAQFVSMSDAKKEGLIAVNDAGHAIMRVDNTSTLSFGDKRQSIRITSKDRFKVGSVWIADFVHVPFGCSTWPSFWSVAPDWPSGGEIDTFEGVNDVKNNRMTLHTEPGCEQVNATQTSTLVNSTDCNYLLDGNQGCVTSDPDVSSYGEAFAAAGGGLYITEFAESGISIWFFNRSSIPSTIAVDNITNFDTKDFGIPVANWPDTGCDINTFFKPQNLLFDITLCGDLAGLSSVFAETCPGDCYIDWVTGPSSNYDNAYFEVRSVKIYGSGPITASNVIKANGSQSLKMGRKKSEWGVLLVLGLCILGWIFLL